MGQAQLLVHHRPVEQSHRHLQAAVHKASTTDGQPEGETVSTDIFYLVPGDHEWPIFDGGDKCEYCGIRYHQLFTWPHLNSKHFCSDCNETIRVELVFNLEGSRGHYLAADYITS